MRKSIIATGLLAFGLMSCGNEEVKENQESAREIAAQNAVVADTEVLNADIVWTGYKSIGSEHTGTIQLKENNLMFKNGELVGGNVVVDMTSLDNTDLDGEWKDKLIGHLNSDDFFSSQNYPTSVLRITAVNPKGEGEYVVEADLTIKDITNTESFTAKVEEIEGKQVLTTNLNIDRTAYNVKYGSSNFFQGLGDKAIEDKFNLDVRIETTL
ncbi:MAG: YceI family protein [Schleiferiaceae bacterium]|nr:YceI family protein [Schleiferiaceae bacterium]